MALYDFSRSTVKYSVGTLYQVFRDKIDLYFNLHKGQEVDSANTIMLDTYPLEEVIEKTGSEYFNNSIAYMMAYAYIKGATEINIFGVDVEADSEYKFERPCLTYWIGWLKAKGVTVNTANNLDKPPFKYGFDAEKLSDFTEMLQNRADAYEAQAKQTVNNEKMKNQWAGAMFATKKIIDIIRG